MSVSRLRVLVYPDPRLKIPAKPVKKITASIQKIIDDMFETHYSLKNCAALAANQLDIINPPAITVIDYSANKNEPLCLINPIIIDAQGEQNEIEGCMSIYPELIHARVKRAQKITVKALDRQGKTIEIEAEEFLAKCIQHELDHLKGIVYLDHLSNLKQSVINQRINKIALSLARK